MQRHRGQLHFSTLCVSPSRCCCSCITPKVLACTFRSAARPFCPNAELPTVDARLLPPSRRREGGVLCAGKRNQAAVQGAGPGARRRAEAVPGRQAERGAHAAPGRHPSRCAAAAGTQAVPHLAAMHAASWCWARCVVGLPASRFSHVAHHASCPTAAARNPHAAHVLAQAAQQAAKREARLAEKAQQPQGAKGKKAKRKKAEDEVRGASVWARGGRSEGGHVPEGWAPMGWAAARRHARMPALLAAAQPHLAGRRVAE